METQLVQYQSDMPSALRFFPFKDKDIDLGRLVTSEQQTPFRALENQCATPDEETSSLDEFPQVEPEQVSRGFDSIKHNTQSPSQLSSPEHDTDSSLPSTAHSEVNQSGDEVFLDYNILESVKNNSMPDSTEYPLVSVGDKGVGSVEKPASLKDVVIYESAKTKEAMKPAVTKHGPNFDPKVIRTSLDMWYSFLYMLTRRHWNLNIWEPNKKLSFYMQLDEDYLQNTRLRFWSQKARFLRHLEDSMLDVEQQQWTETRDDDWVIPARVADFNEAHPFWRDFTIIIDEDHTWLDMEAREAKAWNTFTRKTKHDANLEKKWAELGKPIPCTSIKFRSLLSTTNDIAKFLKLIEVYRAGVQQVVDAQCAAKNLNTVDSTISELVSASATIQDKKRVAFSGKDAYVEVPATSDEDICEPHTLTTPEHLETTNSNRSCATEVPDVSKAASKDSASDKSVLDQGSTIHYEKIPGSMAGHGCNSNEETGGPLQLENIDTEMVDATTISPVLQQVVESPRTCPSEKNKNKAESAFVIQTESAESLSTNDYELGIEEEVSLPVSVEDTLRDMSIDITHSRDSKTVSDSIVASLPESDEDETFNQPNNLVALSKSAISRNNSSRPKIILKLAAESNRAEPKKLTQKATSDHTGSTAAHHTAVSGGSKRSLSKTSQKPRISKRSTASRESDAEFEVDDEESDYSPRRKRKRRCR